jgi:branched-chain amino acid transport system substrate-binding protein
MKQGWPSSLLVAAALAAAACEQAPQRLAIGVALSPTNHPGVELALQEINAAGGVGGRPIEPVGLDWKADVFDPTSVLEWAERFARTEELVAVIGHSDSTSTLSAAAVYNQHRLPQIVTIATHPAITNIGDWTYRLCISDARQGPALAEYAVRRWGKRRIAVFYVNDDYGRGLDQRFEQRVRELGGEIVASVLHRNVLQPEDYELIASALARLRGEGEPDLFALFQRIEASDWIVQAIRDAGFSTPILGGDNLSRGAFLERNAALKEGIRASHFFLLEGGGPRAQQFVAAFRRFAGQDPDYGTAFAYDAVYLLRDAIAGGGGSREGVKAYLDRLIAEGRRVEGATGAYVLGADHDARREFFIAEVEDGRFVPRAALSLD